MTEKAKLNELIQHLESITPEQLIHEITDMNATKSDLNIIEKIRQQAVPDPVVNAILYYMLYVNKQISWSYIQSLSKHLAQKEIKTARQTIEYLKKNHQQTEQQKTKQDTEEQTLRKLILQAVQKGYNDEQLGHYIRSIVMND
ncbi:DnaD domain protein [Pseudogracilibacillus sp. SO10305]|uniref:DnaD domain protein n=1 Tax=Pseudogracilibacillus sp. SO10305 TaxID=3098292 RepID=UPI00300E3CA2